MARLRPISVDKLRNAFDGQVIGPDDADYEQARRVFYRGFDRRPAAILRPSTAVEVAQVVALARESGSELAVRSGGHSVAGHGVTEGGIVLDLSGMRALDIDLEHRTAWAQTGLTGGEYATAVGQHGLATGFGDTGSVGVGGLTLGGGIGFLVRKHGMTIDSLLAAEIVTARGEVLHVDDRNHPDLFWAIRGGGGNFGVATRLLFRLHPVPAVFGGMLMLPATPPVIEAFIAEADAAPEELSAIANIMVAPLMPPFPLEIHGQMCVIALICYAGDPAAGERAIAPFRKLATPLADMLGPMPYPELFPPGPPSPDEESARSLFPDVIDRAAAEAIVGHLEESSATMAVAQLRVLGGAMARVPADATAYAHRDRRFMAAIGAVYERPQERPVHEAWVDRFAAALAPERPGVYVGFLGDEGAQRVRDAYPGATWARLVAVKDRYDPTNLFRLNQNIPPSTDA